MVCRLPILGNEWVRWIKSSNLKAAFLKLGDHRGGVIEFCRQYDLAMIGEPDDLLFSDVLQHVFVEAMTAKQAPTIIANLGCELRLTPAFGPSIARQKDDPRTCP